MTGLPIFLIGCAGQPVINNITPPDAYDCPPPVDLVAETRKDFMDLFTEVWKGHLICHRKLKEREALDKL